MKRGVLIIILLFSSIVILRAQTNGRYVSVDTIQRARAGIDTVSVRDWYQLYAMYLDELEMQPVNDRRVEMITIDKKVLSALLRPFYKVSIDSVRNDTLIDADFSLRYRKMINPINNDTNYIPLPRAKKYIQSSKRLKIDTLKILDPIKQLDIVVPKYAEDPIWWHNRNNIGIDISEATFVNWHSGGNNSISGLLKLNLVRQYKKLHLLWNNEIFVRYGLNQQQDVGLRKTDDKLQYNSTFGYRRDTISNWFYSIKLNFNTQFTKGYSYPDTATPISRFMAPGYLFLGAGTHYEIKDRKFSVYLSPVTLKSTFVFDKDLSDDGAYGVEKGKNSRHEFGALVQSTWNIDLAKNVGLSHKISLYSDYLHDFGNIDVDWELQLHLSVNKYLKATLGGFLLYDDDIKFKKDTNNDGIIETFGPRTQFKQLLGIGVVFLF